MDKTEYRIKLDEMNRLVEAQDYEGALTIADAIDWRKVKSVRTLCMVADIYEVNGDLDESMRMLQLAFKRSSVGKMILYRQVELSLKMGDYDEAVEYYNHYLEIASNDTSKYILKYKIYKAQKAPLEDQIAILEEYKDREYTERWVYELARLYKKAGNQNKCVETCDDLILWFGEGKYVTKAMELKMTYVPLNAAQRAKYEQKAVKPAEVKKLQPAEATAATVAGISAAAMASLQRASAVPKPEERAPFMFADMKAAPAMEEAAAAAEPEVQTAEEQLKTEEIPEIKIDTEQLQERLAKSFQEVLSGLNRTKVVDAFEALGRATNSEMPQELGQEENIEEYQVKDLEPELVNEAKISADKGEAIVQKTEVPETTENVEKEEKPENKETASIEEFDLDSLFAETSSMFAEEIAGSQDVQEELPNIEEEFVEEEPEFEEFFREEEATEEPQAEEPVFEKLSFEEPMQEDSAADEAMAAFEAALAAEVGETVAAEEAEEVQEETEEVPMGVTAEIPSVMPSVGDTQEFSLEEELLAAIGEKPETPAAPAEPAEKETPEEKKLRILNATRPEKLTEHQKNLFSYFAKVPGMDEQILDAINGVYQHADEKTSHRGNIAIMGSHGTGKTRLSEGLVKAICKELGLEAVKYANLDASDMNRKDPAAVIGKMAGGFLLIERASYMTPETIDKLSRAMDFRTDSMILLIEDDKANMRKMLADYPEFAKKFETVISIPVFTNDELVTFARTYAKENGYRMDEMGVLALYTLIGDNQREDEPITIGKVKEMVDGAIRKSSGVRLGRKISKRHTDADGRILLYEKDFDL